MFFQVVFEKTRAMKFAKRLWDRWILASFWRPAIVSWDEKTKGEEEEEDKRKDKKCRKKNEERNQGGKGKGNAPVFGRWFLVVSVLVEWSMASVGLS